MVVRTLDKTQLLALYAQGERDFQYVTLENMDLTQADLSGADFSNGKWVNVSLDKAILDGMSAVGLQVYGSSLMGAHCEFVDFRNARLQIIYANYIRAKCANFSGADLRNAYMMLGSFTQARFDYAQLQQSDFISATMTGASFIGARAHQACFIKAHLAQATFDYAILRGAKFDETDLDDTSFVGARLNHKSHHLIATLIERAAGEDVDHQRVAKMIRDCDDCCWEWFAAHCATADRQWLLEVFAPWPALVIKAREYMDIPYKGWNEA